MPKPPEALSPQNRYLRKNAVPFNVRFFPKSEQDLLDWLNAQPNKSGAVKDLIRAEIARKKLKNF